MDHKGILNVQAPQQQRKAQELTVHTARDAQHAQTKVLFAQSSDQGVNLLDQVEKKKPMKGKHHVDSPAI